MEEGYSWLSGVRVEKSSDCLVEIESNQKDSST